MLVPHHTQCIPHSQNCVGLVLLGSTGSIGTSTLKVVRNRPDIQVLGLAAGKNVQLLAEQVREFRPQYITVAGEREAKELKQSLPGEFHPHIDYGSAALDHLVQLSSCTVVVAAMVGVHGLRPVLRALEAGKRVCLANKETLVAGGSLVKAAQARGRGTILPVDSEHAALFQLLQALSGPNNYDMTALESLVLTASGGPFLDTPIEQFPSITPEQAVKHPRWNMGAKISIDSATLVNKALEVIEAYWLFNVPPTAIEVVVHPQSIVHSLLRLRDGCMLAQMSQTDMCAPISYALGFPERDRAPIVPQLDLPKMAQLSFRALDNHKFPAVSIAKQCISAGAGYMAMFNIANEIAVERFLLKQIKFSEIVPFIETMVGTTHCALAIDSLEVIESLRQFCEMKISTFGRC